MTSLAQDLREAAINDTGRNLDLVASHVAHAEIRRQAKEIEGVMWLEQQHWDKDELFELVNNWTTKDGKRHPGGLMDAIGAAIAQQKETK